MIKIFRTIRQRLLKENRISKYMLYAFGEIVLVVIGIMIALGINNANQKRLDEETLTGYLNSIAQNVESDLRKAEKINEIRKELFPRISLSRRRMTVEYLKIRNEVYGDNLTSDFQYSVENLDFASRAVNDAWETRYLTPDLSGFESLKNSGFLSQLQGTDLEKVLYNYYNLIDELITRENNYNSSIQSAKKDFLNAGLPGTLAFFNAGSKYWRRELGQYYETVIDNIAQHPTMLAVYLWPYDLIIKYENLLLTGKVLSEMILNEQMSLNQDNRDQLAKVYAEYGDTPYPKVMRSGYATSGYNYAVASTYNDLGVNLQYLEGYLAIQFSPQPWAVAYFFVGDGVVDPNRSKDFSKFTTLRIKLRGTEGGEQIQVSLKDVSNPTDGSETKVPLTLSKEWKTYDIPLSSFAPTRLEEIFIVTTFIVENQAFTIEVESIEFL
jgi:hypothetical protein